MKHKQWPGKFWHQYTVLGIAPLCGDLQWKVPTMAQN